MNCNSFWSLFTDYHTHFLINFQENMPSINRSTVHAWCRINSLYAIQIISLSHIVFIMVLLLLLLLFIRQNKVYTEDYIEEQIIQNKGWKSLWFPWAFTSCQEWGRQTKSQKPWSSPIPTCSTHGRSLHKYIVTSNKSIATINMTMIKEETQIFKLINKVQIISYVFLRKIIKSLPIKATCLPIGQL